MNGSPSQLLNGRILVVDKDISMREMMEMALLDQFQVLSAPTTEKGLELIESAGPFDIVISGFSFTGMNGLAFLRRVSEILPETVRILMTGGNVDVCVLKRAISTGHISRFVIKPFDIGTLMGQLDADVASLRAMHV